MEYVIPVIVGLIALAGSVWSAFIVHGKTKTTIELKLDHQTEVLDKRITHMDEKIDLKLKNLGTKVETINEKVECVEKKVDKNIDEVGKVKTKVVALEKDVENIKKGGVKLAKT